MQWLKFLGVLLIIQEILYGSTVVRDVRFKVDGYGSKDTSRIVGVCKLKKGDIFSREVVHSDVKALIATGWFSDVKASVEREDDGVVVTYILKNRFKLVDTEIKGVKAFSLRKIKNELNLNAGDMVDEGIVEKRLSSVKRMYIDKGYRNIEIEYSFEVIDEKLGTAKLIIEIVEGERSVLRGIRFEGNHQIESSILKRIAGERSWFNPLRWFGEKKMDFLSTEEARSRIIKFYLDRGYLNVDVSFPEYIKEGLYTRVKFEINEGKKYYVRKIEVRGVSDVYEPEVRSLITVKNGDVASRESAERCGQSIMGYYFRRGYADVDVKVFFDPDKDKAEADLYFIVKEGEVVRIRDVIIKGNNITKDKVIRREIAVMPADLLDREKVMLSRRRLFNMGYFSRVDAYDVLTYTNSVRDVIFDLEERSMGQLMIGVGYSSIDRVLGYVELGHGNFDITGWPFIGGGQKIKVRGEFGSRRKSYTLSFLEPWFFDIPLSFGVDIYNKKIDYRDYDLSVLGGDISFQWPLFKTWSAKMEYSLEKERIVNVADTNEYLNLETGLPYYFTEDSDAVKSGVMLSLLHDSRDSIFRPTSGNSLTLSWKVTGGPFGFDEDLMLYSAEFSQYFPLWIDHVFMFRTRADVVKEFGSTEEVPLRSRLFLGGGKYMRGFGYRKVGPKAIRTDEKGITIDRAIGGKSRFAATFEYLIPLGDYFAIAFFYDTGNVWWDSFYMDFKDLASSAGVGIRINIPGFPIRIDRAWVIEKDDEYTDRKKLDFYIGF